MSRSTRAVRVRVWVATHAGELTAVGAPTVAAVAVTPWAWAATALTGALWARHEFRHRTATAAEGGELEHDEDDETSEDAGAVPGEIEVRHG